METGENNSLRIFYQSLSSFNKPLLFAELGNDFLYFYASEQDQAKKITCFLENVNPAEELSFLASQKQYRKNIHKFYMCVCSLSYTLVPAAIFDKNYQEPYLKLNVQVSENDTLHHKNMDVFDAVSVYGIDKKWIQLGNDIYPGVEFCSSAFVFATIGIKNENNAFSIYFYKKLCFVRYIKNHQINFFNGFFYNSVSDAVYYALYTFDQLKLNNETEKIHIAGTSEVLTQITPEMKKYIKNIEVYQGVEQQYANLFNIQKCV